MTKKSGKDVLSDKDARFYQELSRRQLQKNFEESREIAAEYESPKKKRIPVVDVDTTYSSSGGLHCFFAGFYGWVRTQALNPLSGTGGFGSLYFALDGFATGGGAGIGLVTGSSFYTAKQIVNWFPSVQISFVDIGTWCFLNMWSGPQYPIGSWSGPHIGVASGYISGDCKPSLS